MHPNIKLYFRGTSRPEILPFGKSSKNADKKYKKKTSESQAITATYSKGGKGTHIKMALKSEREYGRIYDPEGISPSLHRKTGGSQEPKIAIRVQGDLDKRRVYLSNEIQTLSANPTSDNIPRIAIPVLTPTRENKRQNGRRFKENGEEMFTLTGQDLHGIYDGFNIRRLTPKECERLQGFPDNWTEGVSNTQRYNCLGNAVTVNVIEEIVKRLK